MDIIKFCPEAENEEEYIYRVCAMKEQSGMTWQQIADIINQELNRSYNESCYRKKYQQFQNGLKVCEKQIFTDDEYLKEIRKQTDELYKAKRQFQDQRREYHNVLVRDARNEHLSEELIKAANKLNSSKMLDGNNKFYINCNNEAVLILTDWHYGMKTDNIWNKYDINECVSRVSTLLNKSKQYIRLHNANKLHIAVLGDLIHGAIHTSVRVASEEDACDQLMHVSELLAEFINDISECVNEVFVYSTYGNHARTIQDKNDSKHTDNSEKIIPWWLKYRLADNKKVHIIDSKFYEFIYLQVLGHDIIAVHGDLEKFDRLGVDMHTLFNKQYGIDVEYVFSGDKHHLESNDPYGIDNIMIRSLCGTDDHANNKRLYSNPGQTLCIFNKEDGNVCTYNIKF